MHLARRKKPTLRPPPGTPPGQVTPPPGAAATTIDVIAYGPGTFEERRGVSLGDVEALSKAHAVVWINVTGLGDAGVVERLGEMFALHRLALEDVVHTHQRPKVDEYESNLYVVFRAPEPASVAEPVKTGPGAPSLPEPEQISLFLGRGFVLTFQERVGDCLDPVRTRVRRPGTKLRTLGPDALAHGIIDTAIDAFFPEIEKLGDEIEAMEAAVLERPTPLQARKIYGIKHDLMNIRRAVWPLRDVVNALVRDGSTLVTPDTRVYLRDCYDHTVQLMDLVEMYREVTSGLMELYLSNVSNRMNQVMKVLTIIATIFMPLTFIAGVYGMNFDTSASAWNMPELKWRYGYLFALALMALSVLGMMWFFIRRGWMWERYK